MAPTPELALRLWLCQAPHVENVSFAQGWVWPRFFPLCVAGSVPGTGAWVGIFH